MGGGEAMGGDRLRGMQIQLSEHASQAVEELLSHGFYQTPEELVEALITERLFELQPAEFHEEIRRLVQEGLDELDAGESVPVTPEFYENLRQQIRLEAARRESA